MTRTEIAPLAEDVVALVEGSTAAWVATCGAGGAPATRVMGARASREAASVTLYMPLDQAGLTLENLRLNPRLAAFFCHLPTYRAVQLKGMAKEIREADAREHELQARYRTGFAEACAQVGILRALAESFRCWPSMAVEMTVDEVYVQTPGPNAGALWQ
jgi:hypothetical protein